MPTVRLSLPLYLPGWLHASLRRIKQAILAPTPVFTDISGERHIEWTFISAEMPSGPGEALEFGCENGYTSLMAAQKGFHVLAVDLQEQNFYWQHPAIDFRLGDFLALDLPRNHFDLVINCSSVEHVGVPGRYGITVEQSDGDIQVMQRFADILKPEGVLLMTAPCGRDAVMAPWCRVYGAQRLPLLLAPFSVEKEVYWMKNQMNRWELACREKALTFIPRHDPLNGHGCSYALCGLVLRKRCSTTREPHEELH